MVVWVLAFTAPLGCRGCSDETVLARLHTMSGHVTRDFDRTRGDWQSAAPGATFRMGDGIKSDADGQARLSLADGSVLTVRPHTRLRFLPGRPEERTLDVELGEVLFEAHAGSRLRSAVGLALIEAGSQVVIRSVGSKTHYEVVVGLARFQHEGTVTNVTATAGQKITVDLQAAELEPPPPAILAPEPEPVPAPAELPVAGGGGVERPGGDAVVVVPGGSLLVRSTADFEVEAGGSFVVHDPAPPSAVKVSFGHLCPEGGRLRLGPRRLSDPSLSEPGSALAVMGPGTHRYAVVCGSPGRPVAQGNIQVLRDPGTSELPRLPPATQVDTDGRRYTILYQNHLPEVRVTWPDAPSAERYELQLTGERLAKKLPTPRPAYVFKPAMLPEGTFALVFAVAGEGAARSAETALTIRFDNAAPTAVVRAPRDRRFKAGQPVEVEGIALPGWQVSSRGEPLALDPQHRFSGTVTLGPPWRAIAIRFEHRERGVHYYLRRPAGRPR